MEDGSEGLGAKGGKGPQLEVGTTGAELAAADEGDLAAIHAVGEAVPVAGAVLEFEQAEAEPLVAVDGEREEPLPQAEEVPATGDNAEGDALVLERKHPLAIRWMHWINFPVLFTMIWSGLLIYWNDSDNAYRHPHEVYRVGVGGVTLFRFFPAWFYTNGLWDLRYKVTTGLGYHFFFMWLFAINGVVPMWLICCGRGSGSSWCRSASRCRRRFR